MNSELNNLMIAVEHLAGFLIVLLALGLLWGLTELMGRVLASRAVEAGAPSPAPTLEAAAVSSDSGIPPDDLAVVAATVAYLLDEPHHIVSVRPQTSFWGQQGRREIHASHRIR